MIADSRITLNCVFKLLFFVRNVCLEVWQLQISKPSHRWLVSLFFRVAIYWSKYNYRSFLKNGPTPASFCSFKTHIFQKNWRLHWDSNSDCRSRRRACWPLDHHHGPNVQSLYPFYHSLSISLLYSRSKKPSFEKGFPYLFCRSVITIQTLRTK